jgi:prepilin-type N-terminal cleavage/methylation domain-containing protein
VNRGSDNRDLLRDRGGFTLIEIIFALVILSIALAGVFSTFNSQHKSYIVQNEVAQMQESVRGGVLYMEDDLRNAACIPSLNLSLPPELFGGTVPISLVSGLGVADGGVNGPDGIFVVSLQSGLTSLASSAGVSVGVSDSLDVTSVQDWQAGDIAIVYNDTAASFVFITGVQDSSTRLNHNSGSSASGIFDAYNNNKLGANFDAGTSVAKLRYSRYAIDSSTPEHPRLVRTYLDNTAHFTSDIVADDIEDMQIRLGVYVFDNVTGTGTITWRDGDHFISTPSDLARVRQVRIQLVGRTSSADPSWDEGPYYDRDDEGPNSTGFNRSTGITGYEHHRRRPIKQVIYLRNTGAVQ